MEYRDRDVNKDGIEEPRSTLPSEVFSYRFTIASPVISWIPGIYNEGILMPKAA